MPFFSHAAPAPERRRFPRFEADVPVIASLVGDSEIASVRLHCDSISEAGISAPGLETLNAGDLVTLELHIPISTQPIWVDTVVRCSTDHCGLEFLSLSDEQREIIKRYCRLQPREKRRK